MKVVKPNLKMNAKEKVSIVAVKGGRLFSVTRYFAKGRTTAFHFQSNAKRKAKDKEFLAVVE